MKLLGLLPLLALAMTLAAPASAVLKPQSLKVEYLTEPLGIDTPKPRLTWALASNTRGDRQTAYQVLVASSADRLRRNDGDLWDSGRVASDESLHVEYAGKPLASTQACFWKVRVWDQDGRPGGYVSGPTWEMGLLSPSDWRGRWIGRTADKEPQPAPLLRKEFEVNGRVKRARVYVCGLGYYDMRLNGRRVGDRLRDPGYTRFDRRALYATHDITRSLKQGRNAVGVSLGTGWYNVHTLAVWYFEKAPWRAAPKLLMELRVEYADGRTETVVSDTSWKTSTGEVVYDSIYGGETHDLRQAKRGWDTPGYDDSGWDAAKEVAPPGGVVSAQMTPPIRVKQEIKPVRILEPKPGVYVFDFGQNMAGHASLTATGSAGTEITLRYAEKIGKDGALDVSILDVHLIKTTPPQRFQTDKLVLAGRGKEAFEARFTYHGFQYVEVTGYPGRPTLDSLTAMASWSDVPETGDFTCSNVLLNRLQRATKWAYLSNLQSILTDCPHREKNGWTGDAHLAAEQALFNYLPAGVYNKWIQDLEDEMRPSGELPGIVPTSGWGYEWGNGPAWDSAFLLIPDYMHTYYGDSRILTRHYPAMKRYVDYLTTKANDGIVSIGLGDWVPWKQQTPVEVTSTAYYYRDSLIVAKAAALLGKNDEARKYTDLAEGIKRAFNAKFFKPGEKSYASDSQTSLGTAIYQGLVPEGEKAAVLANLVRNIEKVNGHIDTGILGAKYVPNALLENGRADVAYRIFTQTDQPGWGWWLAQGATTLWESWGGEDSRNHIMFGDISSWFYKALAGIVPDPASPGFKRFTIKPHVLGDLTHASGTYESLRGRIASGWRLEDGRFSMKVTIPANTTATVFVPAASAEGVNECGRSARDAAGLRYLRMEDGYAVFEAGSGSYAFATDFRR
jgi:alpha-L-rhamnosidase